MITREEALERADRWINGSASDIERLEVGIYEFPAGYVVWGMQPLQEDPSRMPAMVGSARGVVDKESGEISTWPPLPVSEIALRYAPPTDRFPRDVAEHLIGAGWRPGREVADAVLTPWYQAVAEARGTDGQVSVPHDAALAALHEFGGLHVLPGMKTAFGIAPAGHRIDTSLFDGLDQTLGQSIFPIGVYYEDDRGELVMDEGGRVFLGEFTRGPLFVADTLDAAIVRLARRGYDPLERVLDDGTIEILPTGDGEPTRGSRPAAGGSHHAPDDAAPDDTAPDDSPPPDPPSDDPPPPKGRRRKR